MKAKAEMVEGPQAFANFEDAMRKVLSVPHAEIQRRVAAEKARSAKNPHKRGPKPKAQTL